MPTYAEESRAAETLRRQEVRRWILSGVLAFVLLVVVVMTGCPLYNVWEQGLAGQAELKRAEQNRQIKIQEAKAIEESAEHLKAAEIKRAEGVAAANKIIGESLKGNESYLHYLWIHNLAEAEKNGAEVIYVPTEAGLPILEAGRFKVAPSPEK